MAVSYHDVLLRNGFTEIQGIESTFNNFPSSAYIRMILIEELIEYIIVEVYMSFWIVRFKDKSTRLEALMLSKPFHTSMQERNDDVNHHSLLNLQKAFKEINIDLEFV